jgi:hypothetical protein
MNSTRIAEPAAATTISEGSDIVGVALYPLMPTDGNAITAQLFSEELKTRLRANGIEPADNGGLFGSVFIVWTTRTLDRNPLLRSLECVIKEMGLWEICELAFFDKSEDYWRTIHPCGALQFDRFFTPSNFQAAREETGLIQERLINDRSDLLRILRGLRGETQ